MFSLFDLQKLPVFLVTAALASALSAPAMAELTAADLAAAPPVSAIPKADAPLLGDTPAAGLPTGSPSRSKAVAKKGKHGKVVASKAMKGKHGKTAAIVKNGKKVAITKHKSVGKAVKTSKPVKKHKK